MTTDLDVLGRLKNLLDDIEKRLRDSERRITQIENRKISVTETTDVYMPQAVKSVPYNGHLFRKAPDNLSATPVKYILPHRADHIIVMGTLDYQVEFDDNVSDATPISAAFSPESFSMVVNKYISYQLPTYFAQQNAGITGDMYVWLLWYGD